MYTIIDKRNPIRNHHQTILPYLVALLMLVAGSMLFPASPAVHAAPERFTPTPIPPDKPTIQIIPESASLGTDITVKGTNWSPDSEVLLFLTKKALLNLNPTSATGQVIADQAGQFSVDLTVPTGPDWKGVTMSYIFAVAVDNYDSLNGYGLPIVQCFDDAQFTRQVSAEVPEILTPGTEFEMIWSVKNTGTCDWVNYRLVPICCDEFSSGDSLPVSSLKAGEEGLISIQMTAPDGTGAYMAVWQLANDSGQQFGPKLPIAFMVTDETPGP